MGGTHFVLGLINVVLGLEISQEKEIEEGNIKCFFRSRLVNYRAI